MMQMERQRLRPQSISVPAEPSTLYVLQCGMKNDGGQYTPGKKTKQTKQHSANKSIKAFSVYCQTAPMPRPQPACPSEYRTCSLWE